MYDHSFHKGSRNVSYESHTIHAYLLSRPRETPIYVCLFFQLAAVAHSNYYHMASIMGRCHSRNGQRNTLIEEEQPI